MGSEDRTLAGNKQPIPGWWRVGDPKLDLPDEPVGDQEADLDDRTSDGQTRAKLPFRVEEQQPEGRAEADGKVMARSRRSSAHPDHGRSSRSGEYKKTLTPGLKRNPRNPFRIGKLNDPE